jgi:hypothetical protein
MRTAAAALMSGNTMSCFSVRIARASEGWCRAVAVLGLSTDKPQQTPEEEQE